MENIYINRIKKVIDNYNSKTSSLRNKIQENTNLYQPHEADRLNKELQNEIESGYLQSISELNDDYNEVRQALASSIYPTNESMSSEIQYFNKNEYPISPSPLMVMAFSDAHEHNYLWQNYLHEWLSSLNEKDQNKYIDAITLIEERLPRTKLEMYNRVFDAGLSMINKIHNGTLTQLHLDYFLSEMQGFNKEFLDKLGSGTEMLSYLKRIESSHIPTRILTEFDDIKFSGEKLIENINL